MTRGVYGKGRASIPVDGTQWKRQNPQKTLLWPSLFLQGKTVTESFHKCLLPGMLDLIEKYVREAVKNQETDNYLIIELYGMAYMQPPSTIPGTPDLLLKKNVH